MSGLCYAKRKIHRVIAKVRNGRNMRLIPNRPRRPLRRVSVVDDEACYVLGAVIIAARSDVSRGESFNFQEISAVLANFGFVEMRL